MTIRLVAIDLDDTLLDDNQAVTPRTAEAIRRTVAAGLTVTLATGRMFRSARPYALQMDLDVPLIAYNGALIRCSRSEETLLHLPIPAETAQQVLELCRRRGWHAQSYINDTLFVKDRDAHTIYYEGIAGVTAQVVGDDIYDPPVPPTKLLVMADPAEIGGIRSVIAEEFGARLYLAGSKPNYLEITHPGANKGAGLAFLANRLGISRGEVMAVGDSLNDLTMIQYAGWGVAMGNATEVIKAAAQAVTGSNDAEGVAEALERYVLGDCCG